MVWFSTCFVLNTARGFTIYSLNFGSFLQLVQGDHKRVNFVKMNTLITLVDNKVVFNWKLLDPNQIKAITLTNDNNPMNQSELEPDTSKAPIDSNLSVWEAVAIHIAFYLLDNSVFVLDHVSAESTHHSLRHIPPNSLPPSSPLPGSALEKKLILILLSSLPQLCLPSECVKTSTKKTKKKLFFFCSFSIPTGLLT